MATTEPQKWSATLGASADVNTLPETTPSGSGRASTSGLFPPVTQLPLDQGGIAPERGDFNALFNLTNSSLHSINFFCGQLISSGVRVLHTDTMVLTVLVTEIVDPQALQAFLNLRWSPTGVGVKIYYVLGPVFGFNGSGLHPFNQAPFVDGGPQDLDV